MTPRLSALAALFAAAIMACLPSTRAAEPTATAPTAALAAALAVTESDNGKTLKLGDATTATIALAGNATTGYSWAVTKVDGDALQQVGDIQYNPQRAPADMVGTGGTSTVTFRAVKSGQSVVTLGYARPWEKDIPPTKTFQVTLVVEKAPASTPASAPATAPATAPILLMK